MYLSELQNKDIVDINGKKIGNIVDINIDNNGIIAALIISKSKFNIFKGNSDEEIKWKQIKKIGEDVILVDTSLKI